MLPVIAAVAAIAGPVIGAMASASDRELARSAMEAAMASINSIGAGPDLARAIIIQQFQQAGVLTPVMEQQINLEMDKVQELVENPENRERQVAQYNAMAQLARTGMGAEDVAALAQIRQQTAGDAQAKLQQILQESQMRGQLSGGAGLAARLSAGQNAANQESMQGLQIGANAAAARRQAIMQAANQAGTIRGDDVGTQKFNIENERLRRQFVDQNSISRNRYNTQLQNQVNMANLQRQQQVSDANVNAGNQELYRQRAAEQQMWENRFKMANAKASALTGQSGFYGQQAANTAQNWHNIGTGVAGGAAGLNQYNQNQDYLDWLKNQNSGGGGTDWSTMDIPSSDSFTMPGGE